MNKELEKRWKESIKPFDKNVLVLEDLFVIPELLEMIKTVSKVLKQYYLDTKLFILDDWHEHDGYVTTESECNWGMIDDTLNSENSLYQSRSGDTFVRKAIFPENMDFLFRYYILEENEDSEYPGIWGDFDICASSTLLNEIKTEFNSEISLLLYEVPAKTYFDGAYASYRDRE